MGAKIVNIGSLKNQLQIIVAQEVLPKLLESAEPRIQEKIASLYASYLSRTDLYQALFSGAINESNAAITLGLTDDIISDFIHSFPEIVEESVVVKLLGTESGKFVKGFGSADRILFSVRSPNLGRNLLKLGSASYISENGFTVPWLKWLLKGSGELDHAIIYGDYPSSRTGGATMVDLNNGSPLFPFNIDDYNRYTKSESSEGEPKSFLVEIAQNETFKANSNDIIVNEISRAARKLKINIE